MAAHLSLSAARADNFYHPPDWDPQKGNLDKLHGQHPLRERAKKLDQGILVIRFEMPFNVWCEKCQELIGKGVRFNAEKKQTGQYHSTKIWTFTMHHHCGCEIKVRTDPKSCEYIIESGAHRKNEEYNPRDQQVIELPDAKEKERLMKDPVYRMQREQERSFSIKEASEHVAALHEARKVRGADGADHKWNRELKREMRVQRREAKALDDRRKELGLPEGLVLKPETPEDIAAAHASFLQHRRSKLSLPSRHSIMSQDIFARQSSKKRKSTKSAVPSRSKSRIHVTR